MVYWKHRYREWFLSNNAVFTWCSKFWWYDSSGPPSTLFFSFQSPSHSLPHHFKFSSWERECSGNAMQWGDCQRCGFSRAAQLWNLRLVSLSSTLVNLQRYLQGLYKAWMSLKMMLDAKPACEVKRGRRAATKEFPLLQISRAAICMRQATCTMNMW